MSLAQVAGAARDRLLAMSATVGLMVMAEMMNAEMTREGRRREARQGGGPSGELAWRRGGVGRVGWPAGAGRAAAGPHCRGDRDRARHVHSVREAPASFASPHLYMRML